MSEDYDLHEADGWFYATSKIGGAYSPDMGDLGRGGINVTRFRTEEGRLYWMQARQWEKIAGQWHLRTESLVREFLDCLTESGRIRRKVFFELVAKITKERP